MGRHGCDRKSRRVDALPGETERQYEKRTHTTPQEVAVFLKRCIAEQDAQDRAFLRGIDAIAKDINRKRDAKTQKARPR